MERKSSMNGEKAQTINRRKGQRISALLHSFQSPLIYHLIRVLLCIIFLWSGISKLMAPKEFAVIIDSYGLIPEAWILPLAIFLPLLEMIFGLGLLLDIKGSLGGITGLLMLFVVILSYGIWLGLDVDCGCFGPQDLEAEAFHSLRPALYRDFAMIAGVIFLYFWRCYRSIKPVRLIFLFNNLFRRGGIIDAHD
jgi:uncharacterized membrane protein YphA (DoxX/SURF4 family)